jgi:demethylmenaquinone methyltransferase/2-methoxy-6-polyprenyl-1,4-benzoquinol methylase
VRGDALRLPFPTGRFDGITCGFALRNFTSLPPVFEECARILRAGGRIALLDVAQPANGLARAVHAVWFRRVVPAIGGLVSDRTAYRYLPESTVYLPAVAEIFAMLSDSGLREIEHRTLGFGAAQLFTATRL